MYAPVGFASQMGVIVEVEANVYQAASFDAPVIATLPKGTKLPMSEKVFGAFYKVLVKKGVYGFVSDVEIAPLQGQKVTEQTSEKKNKAKNNNVHKPKIKKQKPFWMTRYLGASVGWLTFNEDILGGNQHDNLIMYGLKITGNDILFDGPPMEVNLLIHSGAPAYYRTITGHEAKGMMTLFDASLLFMLDSGKNKMIYLGLGPMMMFSNFDITAGSTPFSLQQMRLGMVGNIGVAVRLGSVAIRGEWKLYKEKYTYSGVYGSLQWSL